MGEDPKVLSKNSETEEFLSEVGEILLNKISFPSVEREERFIIEQKLAGKTGKEILSEERERTSKMKIIGIEVRAEKFYPKWGRTSVKY